MYHEFHFTGVGIFTAVFWVCPWGSPWVMYTGQGSGFCREPKYKGMKGMPSGVALLGFRSSLYLV